MFDSISYGRIDQSLQKCMFLKSVKSNNLVTVLFTAVLTGCGVGSAPVVTKAEYDQISTGMSVSQVQGVVGDNGSQMQNQEMLGIKTETWSWQNSDGSNLICMFQNGQLINKTQTMLE